MLAGFQEIPMTRWTPRLGAACLFAVVVAASAQTYPSKPIRMVTQFSAGSGGDALVRVVTNPLSEVMGQPVVIENRAGAGGVQAAESIARSAPDGYTIGALTPGVVIVRVVAGTKISIDPQKDLLPVAGVGQTPSLIVAHPAVPVNSFQELLEYAKKNPGKLSYATSGVGSPHHLALEQLRLLTGAEMVHVPYKAGAQAMLDVVSGLIPIASLILPEVAPQAKAGKIKVLATREARRLRQYPDVPAIAELVPGFEAMPGWTGIFAPTGLPPAILKRISSDLLKVMRSPDGTEKINGVGFDVIANTPEEFAAQIRRETQLVARVAKQANIKLE
jgi:tripartite-type tricarboxylate transporter receptor subunit TctC